MSVWIKSAGYLSSQPGWRRMRGTSITIIVIRMAYLIEKEFEEFYKNAVKIVEDEDAKKILTELSVWEGQHREYFKKQYEQLLSKNWEDAASILFAK